MLTIEWTSAKGWLPGRIIPYQNLSLDPATCVFHYAFECFEGLKAYKVVKLTFVTYEQDKDDKTRLFRPDKNMRRFNISAARIALPVYFKLATRLKNRPSMAQSLPSSSLSLSKLTIDGFQGAKATHCI
jgi:branched-subunit amino acid aminotransferase/4-amino-4-deoxychorismate lyase